MLKSFKNYFFSDIRRFVFGYGWFIGTLGVTASLFYSLERAGLQGLITDVIGLYDFATNMNGVMIAFVFCAVAFATVYSDDLEQKYIRYSVIRGSLKGYVESKAVTIYFSPVLLMIAGSFLFLLLCRTQFPWIEPPQSSYTQLAGCYAWLFEHEHYWVYCLLSSLHIGLIAGALSNFAAMCSVFITNRALVLAIPAILFLIGGKVGVGPKGFYTIYSLFAYNRNFEQDWMNFLFVVVLTAVSSLLFAIVSYWGIKRRI